MGKTQSLQGGQKDANAWAPGLLSTIPARLLPQVSLFLPDNSLTDYASAKEAADFCGLEPQDMAELRLERLITHELLIRVTADLSVPDGPQYSELGLNLRGMAQRIATAHLPAHMPGLRARFEALREEARARISARLHADLFKPPAPPPPQPGLLARLLGKTPPAPPRTEAPELTALSLWESAKETSGDPLERAVLSALVRVLGGHLGQRGTLLADAATLERLCLPLVMNEHGSAVIGAALEPIIAEAATAEGYRVLPAQDKPFFMNVKGASASGKSTIRPAQRALAERIGIPWEDFALVSPDYWRKYLLDYESLGEDYKYAAMLTGQELAIIDRKLDLHMQAKAAAHRIPHMLIDRFRFDSFSTDAMGNITSRLLTRFGDTIYLFFLITPPAETVERAWKRGLETGRFKAVDDLLYHNIEAYRGMPELFLSWTRSPGKRIHFEFLDNDVPLGEPPRTVAFGWNRDMVVLDEDALHNIDRFSFVNVEAQSPEEVLRSPDALAFFERCVAELESVTVLEAETGAILRRARGGTWEDPPPGGALSPQERADMRAHILGASDL